MKQVLTVMMLLTLATTSAVADDGKPPSSTGLSVFANAGGFWASKNNANFYSGREGNANTIYRILHSNTYGTQIWNNLVTQGLISPSAIGSYNQLKVIEYPDMYYRTSYQVGLGIRYDYQNNIGWLLRFDIARLQSLGAFNLSSDNGTGILGSDQYIRCGMLGREDRINIDLALTYTVPLTKTLEFEVDLGACLVNSKVKENLMEIGGSTYSILDIWGSNTPDAGVGSYEYINQGGVGYGVLMSALIGYRIRGMGAMRLGYTCYQTRIILEGYNSWGWQHMLGLRIEMNNFSL